MKLNHKQIKVCTAIILLIILTGQGIWVYNMYRSYREQAILTVDKAIERAILREGQSRYEQSGGTIVNNPITEPGDTARFVTRTITSIDTSFDYTIDRYDAHWEAKLHQYLLILDDFPVNVQNLETLFRIELRAHDFPLAKTAVEYIRLADNEVMYDSWDPAVSNKKNTDWISTTVIPIDLMNTVGIRAYAELPTSSILGRMLFQLVLSIILIVTCIFFLSTIIRTFFWREKVEKLRQDSVNAMIHEFKRPISAAVIQASLIPHYLDKDNTERARQYAGTILLEMSKLTAYTERVQKLSNNENERIVLHKEYIVLQDFFTSLVDKYSRIDEKPIDISLSIETRQAHIYADPIHFANMIENLVENAIKYSREHVAIHIAVTDQEDRLCIRVKDNGLGIAEGDIGRVFDKFYRSEDSEVQKRVGFGLGLTYVKALADAHEAEIKVESKFGRGTEFSVYFPLKNKDAQQSTDDRG